MKKHIALALAIGLMLASCATQPSEVPQDSESSGEVSSESASLPETPSMPKPEPSVPEPEEDTPASQQSSSESPEPEASIVEADPSPTTLSFPEQSTSLDLNPHDVVVYVKDIGQYTVSDFSSMEDNQRFAVAVNHMESRDAGAGVSPNPQAAFLLVRNDFTKFQYTLSGTTMEVDDEPIAISDEQAKTFLELSDAPICGTYAQWLIYMNPNRVVRSTFLSTDGMVVFQADGQLNRVLEAVRWLGVVRGSGTTYTPDGDKYRPRNDLFQVNLLFDSGVTYALTIDGTTLYLESSDMGFGCRYTLSNPTDIARLRHAFDEGEWSAPEAENPSTGKPVIYLYPETTTDVSVRLDFKGRLAYTFPEYNGGWSVTAQPDGTLTNHSDGSTHYYLFWDGFADRQEWDFSKGFVVAGKDVQVFFQEKLPAMGLTPREYNDFITYWTPELARNPYNLITFSTDEYEETAPLAVSPQPDTVLRVHMVYKALSAPVEVEEPILPPAPVRRGFTLVEWGGTRA